MQRPRCSMKFPKMRRSTSPIRRFRSMPIRAIESLLYSRSARGGERMPDSKPSLSRRRFLEGAALGATALTVSPRRASAQAKPTVTYWNGLTGADGKIMDELIDHFTRDTGIRMEQQADRLGGSVRQAAGRGAGRRGTGSGADPHRRDTSLRERRHSRADGRLR